MQFAQHFSHLKIVKPVNQTVRAKQKNIAPLKRNRANLRLCELISAAQCALQCKALRMFARLAFSNFSLTSEPTHVRVIVRQLFDLFFSFWQMINAAVADVAKICPARREPAQTQCRLHSFGFFVTASDKNQRAM